MHVRSPHDCVSFRVLHARASHTFSYDIPVLTALRQNLCVLSRELCELPASGAQRSQYMHPTHTREFRLQQPIAEKVLTSCSLANARVNCQGRISNKITYKTIFHIYIIFTHLFTYANIPHLIKLYLLNYYLLVIVLIYFIGNFI